MILLTRVMRLIRWIWKGPLSLVTHQIRYNLIARTRTRQGGLIAAIGFPVIFLVLFVGIFGNDPIGAEQIRGATYYVPGIAALAVVVASFTNLVTALVNQRESGILRRRRASPVPVYVLIAAQAVTTLLISLAGVAVMLGIGRLACGVTIRGAALWGVLLTTLVGSATFCCLAYALSTGIGTVDSATPTVQAIILPLYFISGVFIPNPNLPHGCKDWPRRFPSSTWPRAYTTPSNLRLTAPRCLGPTLPFLVPGQPPAWLWPSGASAGRPLRSWPHQARRTEVSVPSKD